MNQTDKDDKNVYDNAISSFRNIMYCNISKQAKYSMSATFIGIKSNISGTNKLHLYIILFPFTNSRNFGSYSQFSEKTIYLTDISFYVDYSFYFWLFEEMKKQNSIIIMEMGLNDYSLKVISNDLLIYVNKFKEPLNIDFEEWYEKGIFDADFIIKITNPYLYLVPFPVEPIFFKTTLNSTNLLTRCKKPLDYNL